MSAAAGVDAGDHRDTIASGQPTYQLGPYQGTKFMPWAVSQVMQQVLDDRLKDVRYDPEDAARLCKELARTIQERVETLGYDRYKLVSQVVMAEACGQGLRVASRCLWDPDVDNFASASYLNPTLVCTAVTFGCYWE
eukprot:TRINITY_DN3782_c0_g2_i1.p2 TRINITY_DN3782_c0_g2~~TRINITY_DN3782_c0_g2_i1.p2  ORF type:complete len:137 (-),score=15.29 TRINITY_DN3782_c0_g2_i1:152-562(-)